MHSKSRPLFIHDIEWFPQGWLAQGCGTTDTFVVPAVVVAAAVVVEPAVVGTAVVVAADVVVGPVVVGTAVVVAAAVVVGPAVVVVLGHMVVNGGTMTPDEHLQLT